MRTRKIKSLCAEVLGLELENKNQRMFFESLCLFDLSRMRFRQVMLYGVPQRNDSPKLKNAAFVLDQYYGLNGGQPKTLKEVGKSLKMSQENVRSIKEYALRRLRKRKLLTNNSLHLC